VVLCAFFWIFVLDFNNIFVLARPVAIFICCFTQLYSLESHTWIFYNIIKDIRVCYHFFSVYNYCDSYKNERREDTAEIIISLSPGKLYVYSTSASLIVHT
jgi:hypothetical protein